MRSAARLVVPAALVLAALALNATSAVAANKEEPLCRFGSRGAGAGQLFSPFSLAVDPTAGHVFVRDGNNRVDEFTPWCEFVKSFGADVAPGPVDERQEVRVRANEGTFKLSFEGKATADLSFNTSAEEVESALNGLESIEGAGGKVKVEERTGGAEGAIPYVFKITFEGALAGVDVAQIEATDGSEPLGGGDPETELEARTIADGTPGGEGLESCTTESGCQAGTRGTRGGQVTPVRVTVGANGDVYASDAIPNPPSTRIQQFDPAGRFVRIWGGDVIRDGAAGTGTLSPGSAQVTGVATTEKAFRVGQPIEATGIEAPTTIAAIGPGTITLSQAAGAAATGAPTALTVPPGPNDEPANEVQTVKLGENTIGGTFTLTFKTPNPSPTEATTASIPACATAAEVQEALNSLPNMGAVGGEVEVTGPACGPWEVEFKGTRYENSDVEQMSANPSGLEVSGGSKEATVSSANQAEVCEVAEECQGGARGTASGQFGTGVLPAIALGSDTLYAADVAGGRIQEFSSEGEYLGEVPDPDGVREGGTLVNLVVSPQNGHLFLEVNGEEGIFELDPTTGKLVRTIPVRLPGALAIGPEGHLYVVEGLSEHIVGFDSSGERISPTEAEEQQCKEAREEEDEQRIEELCDFFYPEEEFSITGLATGPAGDLYVANRSTKTNEEFVQAYGPPPLGFEAPPPGPPEITAQFAVSVGAGEAELRAQINPHFAPDTRYYLQYGTGKCSEGGCPNTKPAPPGALLTEAFTEAPLATDPIFLAGLAPATTYHYRFVAQSSGGGPVFGVGEAEAEAIFTTTREVGEGSPCPNEAFRAGPAAKLPDCRAYELVSPVDKSNARINSSKAQASLAGERLAFEASRPFSGAPASLIHNPYLAARTERGEPGEGWSTHPIGHPLGEPLVEGLTKLGAGSFEAFSPDLCQGWFLTLYEPEPPLDPAAPAGFQNVYRRTDDLCGGPAYEALVGVEPLTGDQAGELEGFSADGSVTVFLSFSKLAAGGGEGIQLYAHAAGDPQPHPACVLPSGAPSAGFCTAGWSGNEGASPNAVYQVETSLAGALSADGSKVFFTDGARDGQVYERLNPLAHESPRAHGAASGSGDLIGPATGTGRAKSGNDVLSEVRIESGAFAVGQLIEDGFERIPPGTTIEAIELEKEIEEEVEGEKVKVKLYEITLSGPATGGKVGDPLVGLASPVVRNVITEAGAFEAGQEVSAPGIAPNTTIEAVDEAEATLTLSAPATATEEGAPLEAISPCTEAATKACTVPVAKGQARFIAAAQGGERALYEEGGSLYEFGLEGAEGHSTQIAGQVLGTMGASKDATRLYFASTEDLDEGGPGTEEQANLYLYDASKPAGERFAYVAALEAADVGGPLSPLALAPGAHLARVAPDGRHAAFMSFGAPTGYDNADLSTGQPDAELYLYDATANGGEGRLLCASCVPSGARPQGRPVKSNAGNPYGRVAAQIPPPSLALHAPWALSADGSRLYFESFGPLLTRDKNGAADVYQWEAVGKGGCDEASPTYSPANQGCVDLISSGQSPADSELVDASPDGQDVFFTTAASLLPSDPGLVDVYDARAGGGFPASPAPSAPCQGEACQSPPPAPQASEPASSAYHGPGNLSQGGFCAKQTRRAHKLSARAKRLRRQVKRAGSPVKAGRLRRKSTRLAKRARGASKRAKRCRQAKKRRAR